MLKMLPNLLPRTGAEWRPELARVVRREWLGMLSPPRHARLPAPIRAPRAAGAVCEFCGNPLLGRICPMAGPGYPHPARGAHGAGI